LDIISKEDYKTQIDAEKKQKRRVNFANTREQAELNQNTTPTIQFYNPLSIVKSPSPFCSIIIFNTRGHNNQTIKNSFPIKISLISHHPTKFYCLAKVTQSDLASIEIPFFGNGNLIMKLTNDN